MGLLRFIIALVRGVLIALNMIIVGGLFLILCILIGYNTASKLGITWLWGKVFIWCTTSRLVAVGKENIPKDKGAVFLFSHSSYLDIPALCATKGGQINFAAKSLLLKFPILGFIMRVVEPIVIYPDRERSILEYKKAEKNIKKGWSFMISPEGGRSSGEELLPFRSGPFIFAMNSNADMVPVLIYGAQKAWPKEDKIAGLRQLFGTIYVEYFPVVKVSEFTEENRKAKAEEIRLMMEEKLKNYQDKV